MRNCAHKGNAITRLVTLWLFCVASLAIGQTVTPTTSWTDFYSNRAFLNGARAAIGTVIQAHDPDSVLCGQFTVAVPGWYGYLHVYGDEAETPEDEGALEGDSISFSINGEGATAIGNTIWLPGNPGGVFQVDLYIGGFPPIIENFPTQISVPEGDSTQIPLSEYVFDQNNVPEELSWTAEVSSGVAISVEIDSVTQVATIATELALIGTTAVLFEVTDPDGFSDSAEVLVAVINIENDAPVITSPAVATGTEDELFVYHATAVDPDGPLLVFTFENLSPWLAAAQDSVFGIPTEGITSGSFRIIASDGQLADTLDVIIQVAPVNDPPLAFDLISPLDGDTVESLTIEFLWHEAYDPELEPLEYIFHLSGSGVDTTVASLSDTGLVFDGSYFLEHAMPYSWHVEAFDGEYTTSSTTENSFWTPPSVGIRGADEIPLNFHLSQNFPNPFNLSTTIRYQLPEVSHVTITIYDLTGKRVVTLANSIQEAGTRSVIWSGKDELARPASTGVYLYEIQAGKLTQTRKMVLLK